MLLEKGLWKQAKKLLQQARSIAEKANLGLYELEFALMERRIIRQLGTQASALLKQNQERALAILRQTEKELNMTQVFEDIFFSLRTANIVNPEAQHLPKIVNELIGEDHENYLMNASFVAKTQYHTMYAMHHRSKKEYEEANIHLRKLLSLFEDDQKILIEVEYQDRYLKALNNYFNNCFQSGTIEQEFDTIMSKLNSVPETNHRVSGEKFHISSYFYIHYYSRTEEYGKILAKASSILEGLKNYGDVIGISRKLTLIYNIAVIYFETRQYEQALDWIISLLNEGEKETKKTLQFPAEMLRLILFYEKKEFSTLKYLARGFLDQFKKSKKGAPELEIGATLLQIAKLYDKPIRGKADQLEINKKTKDLFIQLHNKIGNSIKREEIKTWLKEKSDGRI
ncbi:MAG: hypothetical protein SFU99_02390 [Saprospiraceae bacterium]|nr:hypothetical protein [Saprospiraceae bacterium]